MEMTLAKETKLLFEDEKKSRHTGQPEERHFSSVLVFFIFLSSFPTSLFVY